MQPRYAMRFELHNLKSLAMRIFFCFFASGAKAHSLDLKSQENARKKALRKSCDIGLRCEKLACFLRSSDAKCLRFGLPLRGLACDASARDVKSLAMWVERCEPLRFAGVLRGNTIRGNTTRNSERKMALFEKTSENL